MTACTYFRFAQIVLSNTPTFKESGIDLNNTLAQEVSLFLRSIQHFPLQPLLFPLVVYRDFFVLVAQCRNGKLPIRPETVCGKGGTEMGGRT